MARPVSILELTAEEAVELRRRVAAPTSAQRDARRASIVLFRSEGKSEADVALALGVSINTVCLWSRRFGESGLEGLDDRPGRGRKGSLPPEKIAQVITRATQPPKGRTRWSTRTMAAEVGISHHSVHTIWKRNDLKPHLVRTFKRSDDPRFEDKFGDVVGLYLDPPEKAVVLCCDEKSQCQALERTQPGLPLGIGHIRTKTHDYKRHGTVTLFAALNYLEGKLITRTEPKHTHVEWLRFLKQIDREVPADAVIHIVADNYATHKHATHKHATHKHATVVEWLAKHPRFHMHFTPTGSSWLNLVERFFADLTADCIREGSFQSTRELVEAIEEYLGQRNDAPKRYVWKAKGEEILKKIQRARAALTEVYSS